MSSVIPIHYCSFCGEDEHKAAVMIVAWSGRSPAICNQCIDMCNDMIAHHKSATTKSEDQG